MWGFLTFLIFAGILGYGIVALARVPEVDAVLLELRDGDSPNLTAVIDRLRSLAGTDRRTTAPAEPEPTRPPSGRSLDVLRERMATDNPAERRIYELRDGITGPRPSKRVGVSYTREAERARIQGSVTLKCTVEIDGSVSDVSVVRSLDARYGLDEQAMMAIRQWQFIPGMRNGQPVPSYAYVEIPFRLP